MNEHMSSPDLIVIGGGVFGLWAARHALKRGERVLVMEKRKIGAGASGGFLGALMPHMPDTWNAKKQMQFDGLVSLEHAIAELEEETGLDCGYKRCGRLIPLRHEKLIGHVNARAEGAAKHWRVGVENPFTLALLDAAEAQARFQVQGNTPWIAPDAMVFGAQFDTLSARINPRSYLSALALAVSGHAKGMIIEGADAVSVAASGDGTVVTLDDGSVLRSGRVVIANGFEAYDLLSSISACNRGRPITGRGVKGQAALLAVAHDDDLPILYDNGVYVVPHAMAVEDRSDMQAVAVGSTSVDDWLPKDMEQVEAERVSIDEGDFGFVERACALCPALQDARVMEHWANIRPRNTMPEPLTGKVVTDPLCGPIDAFPQIEVAIGGFKIGFGVAHVLTKA